MITSNWLPPNNRNSKTASHDFAIQSMRKICCTFTAEYMRGSVFFLVAGISSEIQMICLFHYRGNGLSLLCKRHLTANVTNLSALLTQLQGINNAGLTLLFSLRSVYEAGVNGCSVHDGLIQYDAIF
jgi:hypothetical protein